MISPMTTTRRYLALVAFAAATVLLIPAERFGPGAVVWGVALLLALRDPEPTFRRRMGVLLGVVALLAAAPIHTALDNAHFAGLGAFFLAVVAGPALILRRTDPGLLEFRLWPRRLRWQDFVYTALSVPLAWAVIRLYFLHLTPEMPTHWWLPAQPGHDGIWRLIVGINCVGIWDELFFVNTVYAVLRSLFPRRVANAAQAVVYTSVLYDMAFTGAGPVIVYLFALTQGAMYEGSRSLVWVLLVHLIVDFFLVAAILHHYYGPAVSHLVF
jgi:hypothetical protein